MSFISYAQNYEDVMLWRALKYVEKGFYIDVGAAWPEHDSVTKAFYDRGWRGINIEPNPVHYASLQQQRPHDINLQVAAGYQDGELVMSFVGGTGLSTLDETIATQHQVNGWSLSQETVRVQTLHSICKSNLPKGQDIHFLKVDVEGFENQVLKGNNWKSYRPWIVLVEATLPLTQTQLYDDWEPNLLAEGYVFAYADGLNRFYVSKERAPGLLDFLRYPPNVFDGFVLAERVQVESRAQQAQEQAMQSESRAQQAKAQLQQAQEQAMQSESRAQQAKAQLQQALEVVLGAQEQIVALEAIESAHLQKIKTLNGELEAVRQELHAVHQANHSHWTQLAQTKQELHDALQSNHHHWGLAALRQERIDALLSSSSWRITAPLRWPAQQQRLLRQCGLGQRVKAAIKKVLRSSLQSITSRPKLKYFAQQLAYRLGIAKRLKTFLSGFALREQMANSATIRDRRVAQSIPVGLDTLSPRAKQIYQHLKLAIENKHTGEA